MPTDQELAVEMDKLGLYFGLNKDLFRVILQFFIMSCDLDKFSCTVTHPHKIFPILLPLLDSLELTRTQDTMLEDSLITMSFFDDESLIMYGLEPKTFKESLGESSGILPIFKAVDYLARVPSMVEVIIANLDTKIRTRKLTRMKTISQVTKLRAIDRADPLFNRKLAKKEFKVRDIVTTIYTDIVLIVDVSGSMVRYNDFLVELVKQLHEKLSFTIVLVSVDGIKLESSASFDGSVRYCTRGINLDLAEEYFNLPNTKVIVMTDGINANPMYTTSNELICIAPEEDMVLRDKLIDNNNKILYIK